MDVQVENRKTITALANKIDFLEGDVEAKQEEYKVIYEKRQKLVRENNQLKLDIKHL